MENRIGFIDGTESIFVCEDGEVFYFIYGGETFSYKPRINNSGYKRVCLKINGEYKEKLVHRLVAETFIPSKKRCKLVNHIDGNRLNNHVSNLEWVTHKQNMRHAKKMRLMAKSGK